LSDGFEVTIDYHKECSEIVAKIFSARPEMEFAFGNGCRLAKSQSPEGEVEVVLVS
jgi:hypothetical protein